MFIQSGGFLKHSCMRAVISTLTAHIKNFGQRHFDHSSSAAVTQHVQLKTQEKKHTFITNPPGIYSQNIKSLTTRVTVPHLPPPGPGSLVYQLLSES